MTRDVLFLSQRVPYPPDRGDRITTWHMLEHFLERGDRVRAGCLLEDPADRAGVVELERRGVEVFAAPLSVALARLRCLPYLITRKPLTLPWFYASGLARRLREWVTERRPDICFAYSSSMGQYVLELGTRLDGCKKIMQFAELDSDKWAQYAREVGFPRSLVYGREARTLLPFERRLANAVDVNLVVSEVERELFESRIPGVDVRVIENGVDLAHFHPGPEAAREPHTLIFTGVMSYRPNVDAMEFFVEQVWPQLREEFADARLLIVGKDPERRIRAWHGKDGMQVSGRVESTVPWFHRARAAVVPLRIARGIQNKVLEAMATGLPVVATSKAVEGIRATPETEFLLADRAEDILAACRRLFVDDALAQSLGAAARAAMESRYSWASVRERLERLLADR